MTKADALNMLAQFAPSDEEFDELIKKAQNTALDILSDKTQSFMPHVIIESIGPGEKESGYQVFFIGTDFNSHENKAIIMSGIGRELRKMNHAPIAVFLLSEAWLSRQDANNGHFIQPRNDPNRRECIIIGANRIGHAKGRMCAMPITRDCDNNIVTSSFSIEYPETDNNILDLIFEGYVDAGEEGGDIDSGIVCHAYSSEELDQIAKEQKDNVAPAEQSGKETDRQA